jgi:hypothetical protein
MYLVNLTGRLDRGFRYIKNADAFLSINKKMGSVKKHKNQCTWWTWPDAWTEASGSPSPHLPHWVAWHTGKHVTITSLLDPDPESQTNADPCGVSGSWPDFVVTKCKIFTFLHYWHTVFWIQIQLFSSQWIRIQRAKPIRIHASVRILARLCCKKVEFLHEHFEQYTYLNLYREAKGRFWNFS